MPAPQVTSLSGVGQDLCRVLNLGGSHMTYVLISKRILEVILLNHLCGNLMQQAYYSGVVRSAEKADNICSDLTGPRGYQ